MDLEGTTANHTERRRELRHPVDTNAVIYLIDLAAKAEGRILDVSLHGCCIHTYLRFPLGIFRRVETEFSFEGLPFRLAGVTQALYDPCTVGIRFLDMSQRKREQLVQLIEEIDELQEREKTAAALNVSPARQPADERSPSAS
ncbi:MAG: PilZ domain-containing protein [Terracidiphilus sp.]